MPGTKVENTRSSRDGTARIKGSRRQADYAGDERHEESCCIRFRLESTDGNRSILFFRHAAP